MERTYDELRHKELARDFALDMVEGLDVESLVMLATEYLTKSYEDTPYETLIAQIKENDAEYLLEGE